MQIITKDSKKEIKEHGSFAFPVNISLEKIQAYEHGTFLWHWHPEVELTWVISGQIEYTVNDSTYQLTPDQGLFGYNYYSTQPVCTSKSTDHMQRLRDILSYIHGNYDTNITLDDIASHIGICKSECTRFFKKHMNMTIFDYILYYRIQESLPLLIEYGSVTEAATMVGFSSPSYYTQIFKRYMKCTPLEYRKTTTA